MGHFSLDRARLMIACGALVAVIAALAVVTFPPGFLDGAAAFWRYAKNDAAEHIIGGRYFIADDWRWPLLIVPGLGLPPGTNVGLTDSIPLVALVAKLARGWYGYLRPYLPIWVFFCYLLQGPACALGLYILGVRNLAALILGGLLAVFTPVLFYRFGHAALCAHFLLLLGLALHLHLEREKACRLIVLRYLPLLLVALLVHIYLFAMLVAMMLASLLQGLWTDRLTIPAALTQLASMALAIGLVMWACGYFSVGAIPMKPYGESALDLAAPLFPAPSGVFGTTSLPLNRPGEDFAWLGAGMLLLIVAALAGSWRQVGGIARDHLPSIAICGLLIVFAVTYVVRIGPVLVLGIEPERVRQAVLDAGGQGGTLRILLRSLQPADWLRVGLYGLLLAGLAALVVLRAWQLRRFRFLRFVGLMLLASLVLLAVRPATVALVISSFQASARFAWVVIYLTSLLAIAGVWKRICAPDRLDAADRGIVFASLRHRATMEQPAPRCHVAASATGR